MPTDQVIQQTIIVSQPTINPNAVTEKKAFFNEAGEPVLVVNAVNEDYTEPDLLEGWEEVVDPRFGILTTSRFFKDATGIVWVDFYAQTNEDWLAGVMSPAFVLPVGYRPDSTIMRFGMWTSFLSAPEISPFMIFANGNVVVPFSAADEDSIKFVAGFSLRPV